MASGTCSHEFLMTSIIIGACALQRYIVPVWNRHIFCPCHRAIASCIVAYDNKDRNDRWWTETDDGTVRVPSWKAIFRIRVMVICRGSDFYCVFTSWTFAAKFQAEIPLEPPLYIAVPYRSQFLSWLSPRRFVEHIFCLTIVSVSLFSLFLLLLPPFLFWPPGQYLPVLQIRYVCNYTLVNLSRWIPGKTPCS